MRLLSRRTLACAAACALAVLAGAPAARAQVTGTLSGTVFDESHTVLGGATVTLASRTQIGGRQTATTDAQGRFRFSGLLVGTFTLEVSAPAFVTHKQQVSVGLGEASVDIVLAVDTGFEDIVVPSKPKEETSKRTTGFASDFTDALPTRHTYQDTATLAPGVDDSGDGNPHISGATQFSNKFTVDGINTTDPVTHTFGMNFANGAVAAVEVSTGSLDAADANVQGGVINIVTKSGSNQLEIDTSARFSDQHLQWGDNLDRGTRRQVVVDGTVGGPIVKDRLWYFASLQGINRVATLSDDPNGVFPHHPSSSRVGLNAHGKLTWAPTPRSRVSLWSLWSPADFNNLFQSYLVEPEAEAKQHQNSNTVAFNGNAAFGEHLALSMSGAWSRIFLDVGPQSCDWDPGCRETAGTVDVSSNVRRGNFTRLTRDERQTLQWNFDLEWFQPDTAIGDHVLTLGLRSQADWNPVATTVPGDRVDYTLGADPYARSEYCANDPRTTPGGVCEHGWQRTSVQGKTAVLYLTDAWKPWRYLTFKPGVALDYASSQGEDRSVVTEFLTATPHVQAIWNATHDGRTVVRASFNQNVDTGFLALARFAGRSLFERTCFYDESTHAYDQQCQVQGGEGSTTIGLPRGPDGPRQKLRPPRSWEYTLGAEREVVTGLALGLDFTYRKFTHQWEDIETNVLWNESGTALNPNGGYRDGRAHIVFDLETPDAAHRRYQAVTGTVRKKEGRFKLYGSYTWARNQGQQNDSFASVFMDNPQNDLYWYGNLPDDHRHTVKLQAAWQAASWLSTGVVYTFQSGAPWNRTYWNPVFLGYTDLRARQGYDPRNVNDPSDDRELRLPDISQLALQARANLKRFLRQDVDVWADVFNVLGLRTTTAYVENDGPLWGAPLARLPPPTATLGLRYRY